MWQDEVDSVLTARLSMAALLTEPIGNKQPLYFVLLHFWSQIFGESETSVRFPSALMGLLTVAATYGLGSVVGNRWTGLGAAFLVAISPVMLWYSQETRMYTLTSFLLVSSCFFMVKYLSAGRVRFLAAFTLLTVMGLFTHYYYLPFVVALGAGAAIWLWRDGRWRDLRILLVTITAIFATLSPRIGVALQDFQNVESTSFTVSVGTLLVHLVGSIGLELPQKPIDVWPLAVGVWLALAIGLFWAWRLRQRCLLLIVATGLGGAAIMLIGAATIELPIALRYFVPLVPVAYIIIAYGAGKIALQLGQRFSARVEPSYLSIAAVLVMVAVVGGSSSVSWADELDQTRKQQWREVATELEAHATEGDSFFYLSSAYAASRNILQPQSHLYCHSYAF